MNWKRLRMISGNCLVAFFSAMLGWAFSIKEWDNNFLWIFIGIIVGVVLMAWDN